MERETNDPLPGYKYWDNYPDYPAEDWQMEAGNGDTRLGYWEWVKNNLDRDTLPE